MEEFMATKVKSIPDGYSAVTPVLVVSDAARAIEFYKTVFGAKERMRMAGPGGKIVHAELTVGDAVLMVADEFPEWGDLSPKSGVDPTVRIAIYVDDVDAVAKRAVAGGAKILIPVADQFYGDRSGRLADPFGHLWIISTHKEDVSPDEMQKRMAALSKKS
jgi:PhnB protein